LKKKSKNPRSSLVANLIGDKTSRRIGDDKAEELLRAVTVNRDAVRRLN